MLSADHRKSFLSCLVPLHMVYMRLSPWTLLSVSHLVQWLKQPRMFFFLFNLEKFQVSVFVFSRLGFCLCFQIWV